jgi:O-antigen/teichoic acid export membrane protein
MQPMSNEAIKNRTDDPSSVKEDLESSAIDVQPSKRTRVLSHGQRSAIWMLIATAASSAARWAVYVILAQLGSEKIAGEYTYALAFCLPTITIFRFGLRILVSTDARRQHKFSEYLAFAVTSTFLAGLSIGGLVIWQRLSPDSIDFYTATLILLVGMWNGFESISECFIGLFQQRERMDLIARSYILQAVTMTVLLAAGMYFFHDLLLGVAGLVAAAAIRLFAYEAPIAYRLFGKSAHGGKKQLTANLLRFFRPRIHWSTTRQIIITGAPLTIVTFLLAYTENLPRYFINDSLGKASLGVFAGLYALANVQGLFVLSIMQSMVAKLAMHHVQGQRNAFINDILKAVLLAVVCGVIGFAIARFFGEQLLALVYQKPAYAAQNNCFQILIVAGAASAIGHVIGSAVSSMRRFHIQVPVQVMKLAIMFFGCGWAVDRYGLEGAAWVVTASAAFSLIAYLLLLIYGLAQIKDNSKLAAT